MPEPLHHLLQISDVLDTEFATALAEQVPVLAWKPHRTFLPQRTPVGREAEQREAGLRIRTLPLLPRSARLPERLTTPHVLARLLHQTADPRNSRLICSTPFHAGIAERWPGPVVYWLTDLIAEYPSQSRPHVERLDRRMCSVATLVCPNSPRLRDYLIQHAGCDPAKIEILSNATRAANVLPRLPIGPGPRPAPAENIARPIAGIIGNLAGNMDWLLLREVITQTPWLSWLFVGPTTMSIPDREQRRARDYVMAHHNAHFVGRQPYGALASYARAFDVAVLPYKRCEPTYSGSSTRFYEHLTACRPMLATRGLEELNHKTPLLTLIDTPGQMITALETLRARQFEDGLTDLRWRASLSATWQTRAHTLRTALARRLHPAADNVSSPTQALSV